MPKGAGRCARCREDVMLGVKGDRAPVAFGEGFYEIREQGGANAFVHGVRPVARHRGKVWHRHCALLDRREEEGGGQGELL